MSTGVIVARMQVCELGDLQRRMISDIISKHDQTMLLLRVSRVPSTKSNPLDAATREAMLLREFPQLKIIRLDDQPLKEIWTKKIDKEVERNAKNEVVLYGEAEDIDDYCGSYHVEHLARPGDTSGSIRVSDADRASILFRKGVFHAVHKQYAKVYPTVDVAIFHDGKLLLAKKPGVSGYRFIGGFADPSDESYEAAAAREAKEETGIVVKNVSYVGSVRVDDWRYRSEQDKIITILFRAAYASGDAAAKDDISEIEWFTLSALDESMMVHEHKPLLRLLKEKGHL